MRGKIKWFDAERCFGFLESSEFPDGIFFSEKFVLLPPGQVLKSGDLVSFNAGYDREGRTRAEMVRLVGADRGAKLAVMPAPDTPDAERDRRRAQRIAAERLFDKG